MRRFSYFPLIVALTIILILGLSVIWSTTPNLATSQAIALGIGIVMALLISRSDPHWYYQLRLPAYWLSVGLLLVTEIIGITTRGSTRWINLGWFNFQTSEFIKPALIVSFAGILTSDTKWDLRIFVKHLLVIALPLGLIFLQPDLGSAISLALIWLGMALSSSIPKKYFFALLMIILVCAPIGMNFLKPYQRQRIESFLNPFSDPSGAGYNVIQSTIAVGSGQLLGKGVRQGTQSHLRFLPERHTDFAFASFAEEFGFIGVVILSFCFYVWLNWLLNLKRFLNPFGKAVVTGFFWWIFGQTVINVGMNMGMMPVTGITLPLISYGGSSLLSVFIGLGVILIFAKEAAGRIDI